MKNTLLFVLIAIISISCGKVEHENGIQSPISVVDSIYRPDYHFTPPSQWMNDPNGMVYYEGEYHLFYQHYPDSNVWGPMHWGHAVSNDMMNWEHLPIALYPDSLGYIFSGSAVIDWNNTSGLGTPDNPPMVAVFTYHNAELANTGSKVYQTQGIAFSVDKGRSWTKYEGNPVLENPGIIDFRDPKVFWNDETEKWVMILAVKDHIEIYTSSDLISWQKESEFGHTIGGHGGVWECPDLFLLPDENGNEVWVMLLSINPGGPQGGSATQYFLGDFDGKVFTPLDSVTRWVDHGADNYAGVTWSDVPEVDGRRLFLGWMSNWQYGMVVPTYEWRSAMTLPRELILKKINGEYRLQSMPANEIYTYYHSEILDWDQGTLGLSKGVTLVEINEVKEQEFSIVLSNDIHEMVSIGVTSDEITFDRSQSGQTDFEEGFGVTHVSENFMEKVERVQIFIDRSSVEVFFNDGEFVMTELVFPKKPYNHVGLKKLGG